MPKIYFSIPNKTAKEIPGIIEKLNITQTEYLLTAIKEKVARNKIKFGHQA